MDLLKLIPKNAEIIFLGDLVDKGLNSKKVIDFVIEGNYKCILGNHEKYMLTYIEESLYKSIDNKWSVSDEKYGGKQTLENYINDDSSLEKHLDWIKNLPSYILIENYFITHGYGLPYFNRKDDPNYKKQLMTNRLDKSKYESEWEDINSHNIINIFGHCAFKEVNIGGKYFGIDTGCVYNNKLTAIELNSKKIIQVPTHQNDITNVRMFD
ncbi:phosphoprotein phosphatase [Halarcobacter ebronensis]|uniref:Calcineurin-like phosphoesterase domain-containing protein n=2 Tax=Halarcobacter ebronensis TaxID=1462615 RepID=A0A4Q1AU25_9BACT|nr:metallophosphoesterase [Halarcobacter ebronensis]QKF80733.1 phosphoprotein phosphatase [Halarcobacter ebronensis]RXK08526.1 hypothetical protein CRV07_01630 [Halarcobacter ebronensis]